MERRASSPVRHAARAVPFVARRTPLLYLEIQWNTLAINVAQASRTALRSAPDVMPPRFGSPDPNHSRPLQRRRKSQSSNTPPTPRH
jgi:hypothetical protein